MAVGQMLLEDEVKDYYRTGVYILAYSPPPGGGGKLIKGFGDGEGKRRGEKGKKRKFKENINFDSNK